MIWAHTPSATYMNILFKIDLLGQRHTVKLEEKCNKLADILEIFPSFLYTKTF